MTACRASSSADRDSANFCTLRTRGGKEEDDVEAGLSLVNDAMKRCHLEEFKSGTEGERKLSRLRLEKIGVGER